jgi:hypothetical protein
MSEQTDIQTVADIPDTNDWQLVTGTHEKNHVLEQVGISPKDYFHGGIFVRVGGGEYTDVFFFGGNVPYLSKSVTRIY